MAKITETTLRKNLRESTTKKIANAVADLGEEVLQTKANQFCFPCLDENGGEWFARVTVEIPTGSREDHEPYDGYSEAETYKIKVENDKAKAEEKAKAKAEKVKRDEEMRKKKKEIAEKGKDKRQG